MRPREVPALRRTRASCPGAASAAPSARHSVLLELGAGRPVAADLREITAWRLEAPRVGDRHLETRHLRLEPADLFQILVLAEGGLDGAPDGRHVLAGGEEEGDRPVAKLELAQDGLGRSVDHAHHVLEPVAYVEGHHALPLGIDPAAA